MISKALLKKDLKMFFRDPMIILILVLPIIISGAIQFVLYFDPFRFLPFEVDRPTISLVLRSIIPLFGGLMGGWVTGFIILEEKESGVIPQLRVSPVNQMDRLNTRLFLTLVYGIVMEGLLFLADRILFGSMRGGLLIFLMASLIGPFNMMILAVWGKNRVQGLTLAKLSSLLLAPPILSLVLPDLPRWIWVVASPLTCFFIAMGESLNGGRAVGMSLLGGMLLALYTILMTRFFKESRSL